MPRPRNNSLRPHLRKVGKTFYICYHSGGRSKRISARTTDRASAELALAEFIQQAQKKQTYSAVPTIGEILTEYEKQKEKEGKSDSVRYQIGHLREFFGRLVAESLTENMIDAYFADRGVKKGTVRRELVILSAALNWAKEKKIIKERPRIKMPPDSMPRDYIITKDEFRRLIAEAKKTYHLFVFIALAIGTLARKSAILGLTWDRVHFDSGLIDLVDPDIRQTNKRRAVVPMNEALRAVLIQAKEAAQSDHVVEYHGKPVNDIKKAFQRCAVRAGLPKVTPHILRHTGASWQVMEGVPIEDVSFYLGHKNIQTTYKHYAKFAPNYLRKAANVLNDVIG